MEITVIEMLVKIIRNESVKMKPSFSITLQLTNQSLILQNNKVVPIEL